MRRPLLAVAFLVLAAFGALLAVRLLRQPPSDEEQIRTLLVDAARAAEEKRIGDAVRDVSERFHGEGLDRREVKQLVAARGAGRGRRWPHRFMFDLAREEGKWKVVGARWRPVTLEEALAGPELTVEP
jgi:hypothetical protein